MDRPGDGRKVLDEEGRHGSDAAFFGLCTALTNPNRIFPCLQKWLKLTGLKAVFPGHPEQYIHAADIFAIGEVGLEKTMMQRVITPHISGVFSGFQREARIAEPWALTECQPIGFDPLAADRQHMIDIMLGEKISDRTPFGRRLGMDLVWKPNVLNIEIFFQLVDDSRADVTERSDKI